MPPATSRPPVKANGTGVFTRTAAGGTGVFGTAGSLKKYCVQVEEAIDFSPDEFASVIDVVLAGDKSWIASKKWMFQRVPSCDGANLRIKLAIPKTVDRLCAPVAQTVGKFSCRNGSNIYINLDRWTLGVKHFPDLGVYRQMVINHEVGHFLGHSHVACGGAGQLAPVMQRQSDTLDGCVLNPYPYPDGVHYLG
ncbi:lipoprotein [Rhizocola hellebori]|uniref:Lipoprotein n=2 Tax=Rhizocola hellebori TaxID=1392758 RepID=A0A8J3Q6W7_9ACTN|nr:lipoprotein [Rhizocola hellebori]